MDQGVAGGAAGAPATYVAMAHLTFDSLVLSKARLDHMQVTDEASARLTPFSLRADLW